jgi:hypothetical protein
VNPTATFLLQGFFWAFLDAGVSADETPLLTGTYQGNPLTDFLSAEFGISLEEAKFEIEAARQEVVL